MVVPVKFVENYGDIPSFSSFFFSCLYDDGGRTNVVDSFFSYKYIPFSEYSIQ